MQSYVSYKIEKIVEFKPVERTVKFHCIAEYEHVQNIQK